MEDKFDKLYSTQTYFDRYNGSVFASLFFLFIFFILISYAYIQREITPIRQNWSAQRCSPSVIPFAGLINPPKGKGKFEFTYENFNFCVNNIIKESVSTATLPLHHLLNLLTKSMSQAEEDINQSRKITSSIRTSVGGVSAEIMQRLLSALIPFQKMVLQVKQTMGRAHATMTTGMYTAIGALWFLISGLLNVYNFIIVIIVSLIASIAALFLIPFGFGIPEAIAMTAVLVAVSVPMGLVATAIRKIIDVTGVNQTVSSVPHCFKKGTLIRARNNILYPIESIPVGTPLACGGLVTAVFKLDASKETMYILGNTTVSGSHQVKHKGKWIYVRNHPNAVLLAYFPDPYIYCLNTSKKVINVGDYLFQDWDEVDKSSLFDYGCCHEEDIFKDLESGFHESTTIDVKKKGTTTIDKVEVGDLLESGEKVIGVVKIFNNKPLYEYSTGFLGTKRFSVIQDLERNPVLSNQTADTLFHILTDKGTFKIKEQKLKDYNWNLGFFNF